jgi:gas vesicle protein
MSYTQRDEDEQVQENGTSRVAWFVTGAVIGAAVAVLYAPKSGKDTREFIGGKAQQSKDAVLGAGKDVAEVSKEMFERGRKLVEDAAELFERGRKLVKG